MNKLQLIIYEVLQESEIINTAGDNSAGDNGSFGKASNWNDVDYKYASMAARTKTKKTGFSKKHNVRKKKANKLINTIPVITRSLNSEDL